MPTYNNNTDLINGNNLMLYVSGATSAVTYPIAYAKSCDLSISTATIDTTNKMSGSYKTTLAGQISWTASCDFMYTRLSGANSFDTLLALQLAGSSLDVVLGTTTDSTNFLMTTGLYKGTVRITSLNLKGEDNGIASCSVNLEGTGALTKLV